MNIVHAAVEKWSKSYGALDDDSVVKQLLPFFSAVADSVATKLGGEKRPPGDLSLGDLSFSLDGSTPKRLRASFNGVDSMVVDVFDLPADLLERFEQLQLTVGVQDVVMTVSSPSILEAPLSLSRPSTPPSDVAAEAMNALSISNTPPTNDKQISPSTPDTVDRRQSYSYDTSGRVLILNMDALLSDVSLDIDAINKDPPYAALVEAISNQFVTATRQLPDLLPDVK